MLTSNRRSVGAVVQWTESASAGHIFEGAVVTEHPDNPNALLVTDEGESAAGLIRHPDNSTALLLTTDPTVDPDALMLRSGSSVFIIE